MRDGEDFGGVRKESQFYSNKLYSHLKMQDVVRRGKKGKQEGACSCTGRPLISVNLPYTVSQSHAGLAITLPRVPPRHQAVTGSVPLQSWVGVLPAACTSPQRVRFFDAVHTTQINS